MFKFNKENVEIDTKVKYKFLSVKDGIVYFHKSDIQRGEWGNKFNFRKGDTPLKVGTLSIDKSYYELLKLEGLRGDKPIDRQFIEFNPKQVQFVYDNLDKAVSDGVKDWVKEATNNKKLVNGQATKFFNYKNPKGDNKYFSEVLHKYAAFQPDGTISTFSSKPKFAGWWKGDDEINHETKQFDGWVDDWARGKFLQISKENEPVKIRQGSNVEIRFLFTAYVGHYFNGTKREENNFKFSYDEMVRSFIEK